MNLLRIFFYANLAAILKTFGFWYIRCGRQICFCMLLIRGKHAKRLFINENDKERDPMLFNDVQDKKGSASVLKYERK